MLEQTVIVCPCLAEEKGWIQTGPCSVLGSVTPRRNAEWLNPGPSAWCVFAGDNGDIKFPRETPTTPETHEKCLSSISNILKKPKNETKYMSHPCGSYNKDTLEVLKELGVDLGFKQIMTIEKEKGMKKINNSSLEVARIDHAEIFKIMN